MRNPGRESRFRFKQFDVNDSVSAMKVGTDGVLLGAWVGVSGVNRVLDVGTGTGLIALMIAQRNPSALVDALEIDADAAAEATVNCNLSPWSDRISVINADFVDYAFAAGTQRWDLIVSNPPFFNNGVESSDTHRARARHESGLSYDTLLERSAQLLNPVGGRVGFISPADRESDIIYSATFNRLHLRRLTRVSTVEEKAPRRLLWEFSTEAGETVSDSIAVRTVTGSYTEMYTALTRDFYLNM